MLKKLTFFIVIVLIGILGFMIGKTLQVESYQLNEVDPPVGVTLDEDVIVQRFANSLTYETHVLPSGETNDAAFMAFHQFLKSEFPLVFSELQVEYVNDWSLLITWSGSDTGLDPIVLMGHLDVVSASQPDRWKFPPFAGIIENDIVWGRGSIDNKNNVMALLETAEKLLEEGYDPKRSIIFSFGHDEETSGLNGAQEIVHILSERDVKPSFVLDEGGMILDGQLPVGSPVAFVANAEKGYVSLRLTARSQGGHSSSPPTRTAVGMLAEAVYLIQENPFPASISGATEDMMRYLAPELPFTQRFMLTNLWLTRPLMLQFYESSERTNAMIRTTIAPTMMSGSETENVLPTEAYVVINFRIMPGETVQSVIKRITQVIDNDEIEITINRKGTGVDPSSVSSVEGEGFRQLQYTIKQLYPDAVVTPMLMIAATDSRYFTRISDQVFRFTPVHLNSEEMASFHAIDEHIHRDKYLTMIAFYHQLLLNMTE